MHYRHRKILACGNVAFPHRFGSHDLVWSKRAAAIPESGHRCTLIDAGARARHVSTSDTQAITALRQRRDQLSGRKCIAWSALGLLDHCYSAHGEFLQCGSFAVALRARIRHILG